MYTYPHIITNGNGETITFLKHVKNAGEDYLEVENFVMPNHGPPMHVHFKQAEGLTVKKGKIGIQELGKEAQYFGEGQSVTFNAGIPHRFWNAGTEALQCTGWIKPAHNVEYFLTELYKSTEANGGKMPGMFDAAYLSNRYKSEFEMMEIPKFVKKNIFPVLIFIGKALGKYKKYANAPAPL